MKEAGPPAPSVVSQELGERARGERIPGASFRSLSGYLAALEGADLSSGLKQMPEMSKPTWDRVRASLTALDLVDVDLRPTLQLHRVARGELTLIEVLEGRFTSLVQLIEAGDTATLDSELERSVPNLTQSGRDRFMSLVRGALQAAGRSPRRPPQRAATDRPGTPRPFPSAVSSAMTKTHDELIRQEAEIYIRRIDEALESGDVDRAEEIRNRLLCPVYDSLSLKPPER